MEGVGAVLTSSHTNTTMMEISTVPGLFCVFVSTWYMRFKVAGTDVFCGCRS